MMLNPSRDDDGLKNDGISDFSGGFWSRLLLDVHVPVV
jgi:hypothetical protein